MLGVPHVQAELEQLLQDHAGGFRPDPGAVTERLGTFDLGNTDSLGELQQLFGDPEVLGAVRSPEQGACGPAGRAGRGSSSGSWTTPSIAPPPDSWPAERRSPRLSAAADWRRAARTCSSSDCSGCRSPAQVERGRAFVAGVIEAGG